MWCGVVKEFAKEYGVNEAFLLSYFHYYIEAAKNKQDAEKFHEGRYWTYASVRTIEKNLDFLKRTAIHTALAKLRDKGLLLIGNFNKFAWDKTAWYSLSDKYYQEFEAVREADRVSEKRTGVSEKRTGVSEKRTGVSEKRTGVSEKRTTIPIQSTYSIPYKGDNKQTQLAKQVNEEADSRFPGTKYDQETYGKALDAYSKYIGYPVEASSTEIVCGMVDDYGLESVLYGFKVAYKNKVRNLSYVERCAQNYNPDAQQKPPRRRHKNDVAAGVAEAQRILAEQEARAEANDNSQEEGEVDFAKLLGF